MFVFLADSSLLKASGKGGGAANNHGGGWQTHPPLPPNLDVDSTSFTHHMHRITGVLVRDSPLLELSSCFRLDVLLKGGGRDNCLLVFFL